MKNLITGALLISVVMLNAQQNKTTKATDEVTIRMKKVEIINGVEKTTDTTYTVKGPMTLDVINNLSQEPADPNSGKKQKKVVIITDEVHGNNVSDLKGKEALDEQIERAIKIAHEEGKKTEKIMLVDQDIKKLKDGDEKMTRVVIIKTVKIIEPTEADLNLLGKPSNKLSVADINFYPNPSSGKFNLSFKTEGKGDAEVSVMDIQGRVIYTERVQNDSGIYSKQIDLSQNPKGIYFLKIRQGNSEELKKLVLE